MADMHDTGQKLIEAFCDIDALVAENERLRAAIVEHDRRNTVDGGGRARCYPVMGQLLEEGNTDA
jgi:hypothetical protein